MSKLSAPLLIVAGGLLAATVGLVGNDGETERAMLAGAGLAAGMVVLGSYLAGHDDDSDS